MTAGPVLEIRAPEDRTLLERFVHLLPIPYPLAALVWSSLLGGPTYYLVGLATGSAQPPTFQTISNLLLNVLLPFYLFMVVRYIRLRIVALDARLGPRLSRGEADYHGAFGRISQSIPVVIITIIFGTLFLVLYYVEKVFPSSSFLILANIIVVYTNIFAFSSLLWEFTITAVGLHTVGGSSLKLESFLDDRMMGAKPMGSLALTLTVAYYGGLLLAFLLLTGVLPPSIASSLVFYMFILVGLALFFLPLNSVHRRMQAEKRRLMRELVARYPRFNQDKALSHESATLDDVRKELAKMTELQELDLLERKITSLPTWPFDIQLLGRLITIIVSVIAAFIARILIDVLKV